MAFIQLNRQEALKLIRTEASQVRASAGMYQSGGGAGATSISIVSTWTKATVNATELAGTDKFLFAAPGKFTLVSPDYPARVSVRGAVTILGGNNKDIAVGVARNGSVPSGYGTASKTDSAGSVYSVPVFGDFTLIDGDYLQLYVRNDTDTSNLTVKDLILHIDGHY